MFWKLSVILILVEALTLINAEHIDNTKWYQLANEHRNVTITLDPVINDIVRRLPVIDSVYQEYVVLLKSDDSLTPFNSMLSSQKFHLEKVKNSTSHMANQSYENFLYKANLEFRSQDKDDSLYQSLKIDLTCAVSPQEYTCFAQYRDTPPAILQLFMFIGLCTLAVLCACVSYFCYYAYCHKDTQETVEYENPGNRRLVYDRFRGRQQPRNDQSRVRMLLNLLESEIEQPQPNHPADNVNLDSQDLNNEVPNDNNV